MPINDGAIISFTFLTAANVPLPLYRSGLSSRNSKASFSPVDAPEGTDARPIAPDERVTSTSTVGFPRESNISRALIFVIFIMSKISY